jgi:ribonuclease P protein component
MPERRAAELLPGRLVASADFERVLQTRSRASTPHFALHHLEALPSPRPGARRGPGAGKLSTNADPTSAQPVEDSSPAVPAIPSIWVGAVVPKRHAKRAVTRSLIKRQIRAATGRHAARLAPGLWIVRLRAPFDPLRFVSAASPALRRAVRSELDAAMAAATSPARP